MNRAFPTLLDVSGSRCIKGSAGWWHGSILHVPFLPWTSGPRALGSYPSLVNGIGLDSPVWDLLLARLVFA